MNVRRFTARTSRDALRLVRQAFGDDAVVLSTSPCADGVEVLAMAPEGMRAGRAAGGRSRAPRADPPPRASGAAVGARQRADAPSATTVEQDVAGCR